MLTYHISENNSSQTIDVDILQQPVWILLNMEGTTSDVVKFCLSQILFVLIWI